MNMNTKMNVMATGYLVIATGMVGFGMGSACKKAQLKPELDAQSSRIESLEQHISRSYGGRTMQRNDSDVTMHDVSGNGLYDLIDVAYRDGSHRLVFKQGEHSLGQALPPQYKIENLTPQAFNQELERIASATSYLAVEK